MMCLNKKIPSDVIKNIENNILVMTHKLILALWLLKTWVQSTMKESFT